jgi:hypothetical protein
MILTSYLYVSVHYRKNNGISSEVAPIGIVTLWIKLDVVNRCWKQLVITTCIHSVPILTGARGSYGLPDDGVGMPKHVRAFD